MYEEVDDRRGRERGLYDEIEDKHAPNQGGDYYDPDREEGELEEEYRPNGKNISVRLNSVRIMSPEVMI